MSVDCWAVRRCRPKSSNYVEGRYETGATVIGSQCPIPDWHPAIGDPTLADAICDRLLHNACRIELKGDSMRRKRAEPAKTIDAVTEKGEEKQLKTQKR